MMIAFDNRIPDSFMLEQLIGQDTNYKYRLTTHDRASQPGNANDRYIAVYDDNQLVGFGHLCMDAPAAGDEVTSEAIFVSPNHRNPDLKQTIQKLLHARKYSRSV
jgi:hypothetical protein